MVTLDQLKKQRESIGQSCMLATGLARKELLEEAKQLDAKIERMKKKLSKLNGK